MDRTIDREQVFQKLRAIVAMELEDDTLSINDSTVIGDLPLWDSVAHFRIVVALENDFEFLFDVEEHTEFETVGEFVDFICNKLSIAP